MHILKISPLYHPAVGGAETHVRSLAEKLSRLGHTVTILTDKCRENSQTIETINGVRVFRTSRLRKWLASPDEVLWEVCYFGILRELHEYLPDVSSVDIIHTQCQVSGIIGGMLKESLNCPLVMSCYETLPEQDPFGSGRSRFIFKYINYDAMCVGSNFFKKQALQFGADTKKVRLIYLGIDLQRFKNIRSKCEMRKKIGVSHDSFLVLMVGRFKKRKGQLDLVHAIDKIRREDIKISCLLAGTCDSASRKYLDKIKQTVNNLGLQDIISIRHDVSWEDLPSVMASADIVVQPSHDEGLCLTLLEAMASKTPVIGTNVTGINEVIKPDVNGLSVSAQSPDELANAIMKIARNKEISSNLIKEGYKTVTEKFNISSTAQQTLSVYKELISRR